MDAIVIRNLTKSFKKSTIRHEYTTMKSELVRWLKFKRRPQEETAGRIEVLKGIDLTIPRGKTVGIIGRNGSGKSTLLKLITGIYTPTTGSIEVSGRISALLELGAGFHPDFSGRENILINGIIVGMSRADIRKRMDAIIEFSEFGSFIDEPVRTYSSGMFMRLAFSVATHVDPDILIVDEILAVGDDHFRRKSMAKMKEFKKNGHTIVLVTHDTGSVAAWCDTAAWIDEGRIRAQGDPKRVIEQYKEAVELAEVEFAAGQLSGIYPGTALPAVVTAKSSVGPQVSPENRWGTYQLEIASVRLLNRAGAEITQLDPEEAVEVEINFVTHESLNGVGFSVAIVREDGTEVYRTRTDLESVPLPSPLPAQGVLRFCIDRFGFTDGDYWIDVAAQSASGEQYDAHHRLYPLQVRAQLKDSGVARPSHHWVLSALSEVDSPRKLAGVADR